MKETLELFMQFLQTKKKKIGGFLGVCVIFILIFLIFTGIPREKDREEKENVELESLLLEDRSEESDTTVEELAAEPEIIYVDVKGAVHAPGMYQFDTHARMQDAISKAGGFLDQADVNQVNLALKLEDQMLIYVPKTGEETSEIATSVEADQGSSDSGKVNLNTADSTELQTLNGIGEKKAQLIIDYREENGSFQQIEDIQNVSGIGEKSFESLKESIAVE